MDNLGLLLVSPTFVKILTLFFPVLILLMQTLLRIEIVTEQACSGLQALFYLALLGFCPMPGEALLPLSCWPPLPDLCMECLLGGSGFPASEALPLSLPLPRTWLLWGQITALFTPGGIAACQLLAFPPAFLLKQCIQDSRVLHGTKSRCQHQKL